MKAYVMWSGGLDSTALIWHYLQRGYEVSAGYIAYRANVGKTAAELRAIDRMLPFLNRYSFTFKGVVGWFRWNYGMSDNLHRGPFGLVGILYASMLEEKFDEIGLGVVREDNVSKAELDAFSKFHRALRPFLLVKNPLRFPLHRRAKKELLATLPAELREHLWTCDQISARQRRPCGRCPRCQRYQELFRELDERRQDTKENAPAKTLASFPLQARPGRRARSSLAA